MKNEFFHFSLIIGLSLGTILSLISLVNKYVPITLAHVLETCQQMLGVLFSSKDHVVGIFLIGITFFAVLSFMTKTLFSYIKTRQKISTLRKRRLKAPPNLNKAVSSLTVQAVSVESVASDIEYAFCHGLWRPKIIISTTLLNKLTQREIEAVLLHEWYHLRSKHPLLIISAEVLSSALFFIPIIKELTTQMRSLLEQRADAFVIKYQKTSVYLNSALIKIAPQELQHYPSFNSRRNHGMSLQRLLQTVLVSTIIFVLFMLPVDHHMFVQHTTYADAGSCNALQCTSRCPSTEITTYRYHSTR